MKIAVVGAGVTGLAIAYNLALRGAGEIHVFEKNWVGYGSSTRSGGRFRVHFWAEENSRFAIESVKRLKALAQRTGWNPVIYTGGYLWLLCDEIQVRQFREANNMWARLGAPGRFLQPDEIRETYPYIALEGILEAFFGPQDGSFHHDYVCFGYHSAAMELGVKFHERTEVEEIVTEKGEVKAVKTAGGGMDVDVVVLAAGAWTNQLLEKMGIRLPVEPVRKEVSITEPYRHFIDPLIIDLSSGAYVGQTLRGEILGSLDLPVKPGLIGMNTRLLVVREWAKAITRRIPRLSGARIMRTWAGYYMTSKDESHIMGRDPDWPEGLYVAYGYSGHGFMMAPLVGELLAENILTGRIDELMRPFLPTRFKEGKLVSETLVIG